MMMKVNVLLNDGKIITRKPIIRPFGNFVFIIIRYKNDHYIINNGDEYLRGYPDMYTLGRKLSK